MSVFKATSCFQPEDSGISGELISPIKTGFLYVVVVKTGSARGAKWMVVCSEEK
jgi:hypothetical protein